MLWRRLRFWLSGSKEEAGIDDEMELHIALLSQRFQTEGMSRKDAEMAARRKFGSPLRHQEQSREMWISRSVDDLFRDVRIGLRGLRRSPSFTLIALVTLSLAIGANTAIFQLVDAIRLRSLPVHEPEKLALVQFAEQKGFRGSQNKGWPVLTNLQWEYLRDHQDFFESTGAFYSDTIGFGVDPRPVQALLVSGDFFHVLGVHAQRGRLISKSDDVRGCPLSAAVVSHNFWQRNLSGDDSVVGRRIVLEGRPVEIIGVTPSGFTGVEVGQGFDIAIPICTQQVISPESHWLNAGTVWWLTVLGRMRDGDRLEAVSKRLEMISPALFAETLPSNYPRENVSDYRKMRLNAVAGGNGVTRLRSRYESPLFFLLCATGLVLLLACANLGNMILARSSARSHEFAIRLSLGASRSQLLRQLLTENFLLALGGAIGGVLLAQIVAHTLSAFLGVMLDLRLDAKLLGFVGFIATVCCLAFGSIPAWRAVHAVAPGTRVTESQPALRLRELLVVTQVVLSLVLVFGALLFSRTLGNLLAVDAGFNADAVFWVEVDYTRMKVSKPARAEFQRELLENIRRVPSVVSAATTQVVPMGGRSGSNDVWPEGGGTDSHVSAKVSFIGSGYVETMGMRLLAGRDFNRQDTPTSPQVAIVNQTFAKQVGLGPNPIGKRFLREATPDSPETAFEVVGLVNDTKYGSLKETLAPIMFFADGQDNDPGQSCMFVVRSRGGGSEFVSTLRSTLKQQYPSASLEAERLETTIQSGLLRERLMARVSGYFGVLAALIAAVGLYGVLAYLVVRRTNEFGIRAALGASPGDIVRLVLGRAGLLVGVGIVAGIVLAIATAQAARSLLFGLEPYDIRTLGLAVLALGGVALAASCIPALRASRLDPLAALRQE